MNTSQYRFTLDLQSTQSQVCIPVTRGDTARTWLISFRDGSNTYKISDGCLAKLEILRPTGTHIEEFCAIEKNEAVRYSFSQNKNTAAVEGFHECAVVLYDEEGNVIGSPRFSMIVSDRVVSVDTIPLSDENKLIIDSIIPEEISRRNAETERINAEAERTASETQRTLNEAARQTADAERSLAEESRNKRFETLQKEIDTAAATLVSPTVNVTPIEGGQRVTMTDNNGKHTFNLMDGKDGPQGVQGLQGLQGIPGKSAYQYAQEMGYTGTEEAYGDDMNPDTLRNELNQHIAEDIRKKDYTDEIVDLVLLALGGQPVFGYVDKNNNIIITAPLADGTYTAKYEMEDGSVILIGELELGEIRLYSLSTDFTNCYFEGTTHTDATGITGGDTFSATISPNSGYELSSVTVTMGGLDITSSAVSGRDISIAGVTGDVMITAKATVIKPRTNFFKSTPTVNTTATAPQDAMFIAGRLGSDLGYRADGGPLCLLSNYIPVQNSDEIVLINATIQSTYSGLFANIGDTKAVALFSNSDGNGVVTIISENEFKIAADSANYARVCCKPSDSIKVNASASTVDTRYDCSKIVINVKRNGEWL